MLLCTVTVTQTLPSLEVEVFGSCDQELVGLFADISSVWVYLDLFICFPLDYIKVLGFLEEENHRVNMLFLTHQVKIPKV